MTTAGPGVGGTGWAHRWAPRVGLLSAVALVDVGCSTCTPEADRAAQAVACLEEEFVAGAQTPVRRTVYGVRDGRRVWRQDNREGLPEAERGGWSGPREHYTYFDDGTVIVPSHDAQGDVVSYDLWMPDGPIDHVWTLHARSVEAARDRYQVAASGRVTAVDAGGRPWLSYEVGAGDRLAAVAVQCGATTRSVGWRYGADDALREVKIDMGSGLADIRIVSEYVDGRRVGERVLRRGTGVAEATPAMVYGCTPWLGAGRGVYEQPASPDVAEYTELSQTRFTADATGRVVRAETTHVAGPRPTITSAYDDQGRLVRRDTAAQPGQVAGRSVRYAYACGR